ncbi:MAG: phosphoribosylaminoimidazolesuccinocarboxamide synthase, partial [Luminiphilus sp.]
RQYLTGSLWRDYASGLRDVGGTVLPEGLEQHQRLQNLLITPSSKGVLKGLAGIPEVDDVNISRGDLEQYWSALGFEQLSDVDRYEALLSEGFQLISQQLQAIGQLFVDTKFEFGYASNGQGESELIYMDEVGTPDSSRIWDRDAYTEGRVVENSKEGFRQDLLQWVPDRALLLDKNRMEERLAFAAATAVPQDFLLSVSETYREIAAAITGQEIVVPEQPRAEINDLLSGELGLI